MPAGDANLFGALPAPFPPAIRIPAVAPGVHLVTR